MPRLSRRARDVLATLLTIAVGALALPACGSVDGGAETNAILRGIPQDGTMLGDPKAKVVLTEFADLQCPYCSDYAVDVLPEIVEKYVRPGLVRLDMRLLRFLGPDSERGALVALAAAEQDRMWQFVDLWYRNQGAEHSGYADDGFLEDLAREAGVKDPLAALDSAAYEEQLKEAAREADDSGVPATPSFLLDGKLLTLEELSLDTLRAEIDAALE
jgi:protein-disulfide isomerase